MARPQSRYVCQSCGASTLRWEGQCRDCSAWNTLVETLIQPAPGAAGHSRRAALDTGTGVAERVPLGSIPGTAAARMSVGIPELDRVLGGGLVPGALVLLGGEPGIGKSTLVLETAAGVATAGGSPRRVIYASGEESPSQLHLRAQRLGLTRGDAATRIEVVAATAVSTILGAVAQSEPDILVVDSIQTVTAEGLEGPAGSVGQIRESASQLGAFARERAIPVVLVGHVTKDGSLAGPRTLEHLVDVVLMLEGDRYGSLRLLRAIKNRFGSTEEVGVLEMTAEGLREVADPARVFLGDRDRPAAGVAVAAVLEGSRPRLIEVQALVTQSSGFGPPRRTASGVDGNRLALLVAVLGRRAGIALGNQDIYVNLAGGAEADEPGIDLALGLALASAFRDRPLRQGLIAAAEVSLLGELRSVPGLDRRLREAARLGFEEAIVAESDRPITVNLRVRPAGTIRDALVAAMGDGSGTSGEG
jgi:DNA repair protein RadA/Sms